MLFCRICHNLFFSVTGDIRACNYCHKIVKAYVEDDLDKSIEALREDMKKYFDDSSLSDPRGLHNTGGSTSSSRSSLAGFGRDEISSRLHRVGSSHSLPGAIERDLLARAPTPNQRSLFDAFGVTPQEANDIKQVQFVGKILF